MKDVEGFVFFQRRCMDLKQMETAIKVYTGCIQQIKVITLTLALWPQTKSIDISHLFLAYEGQVPMFLMYQSEWTDPACQG